MKNLYYIFILLLISGSIAAYDFETGRQTGMAGMILFSAPTATDLLSCPSGQINQNHFLLEAGIQRKFELPETDQFYLAGGYRYSDFTLTLGLAQFGKSNYYVEQKIRSTLTYNYKIYSAGLLLSGKRVDVGADYRAVTLNSTAIGLAGGINYNNYHLALVIDNLNRPRLYEDAVAENRIYNLFAEIEGRGKYSITARVTFEQYEKPQFALGQHIGLYDKNAVFWGIGTAPLRYGGGVEIFYSGITLTYATSFHPVLGFSHNISLGYLTGNSGK
jgi:hypothetical protein